MIKAVIFDLDGTLMDLPVDYEKLFKEVGVIMERKNVRPLTETVSTLDERTRRRIFKMWDNAEVDASTNMVINRKGVAKYKKFTREQKALVTMQGTTLVKLALRRLRLTFDIIVTREDTLSRVEQLEKASQKLKTPFQDILFIGNTEGDLLAAKEVGCQFLRMKGHETIRSEFQPKTHGKTLK